MRMGKDTAATLRWVLPQPSGCHRGQTSTTWVVKQWGNKCITMYKPTCLKRKTCKQTSCRRILWGKYCTAVEHSQEVCVCASDIPM